MNRLAIAPVGCVLAWALTVAGAAHQSPSRDPAMEDWSAYLPPGKGKALVAKECAGCHTLEGLVRLRGTQQVWEAVVFDMVARGAPLRLEEVDPIVDYLATAFGPAAPPLVEVNTASADELVKLPGLTPALADRLIEHRRSKGPFASREEVRVTLGIDEAAFEKMKWSVRAARPSPATR